jgi:acyl-coenzyme A synthetase/AMP-(fatty) acid ligase
VRALAERNRSLAEHKRVAVYIFWDPEFPKTASLKVKRDVLAQAIARDADRALLREV